MATKEQALKCLDVYKEFLIGLQPSISIVEIMSNKDSYFLICYCKYYNNIQEQLVIPGTGENPEFIKVQHSVIYN